MASYYPQPSRPSWADMSKNERKASGMTKKEYNRQGKNVTLPQPSPGMPPRAPEPRPPMKPQPSPGGDVRPPMRPQPSPGMPPRAPQPSPPMRPPGGGGGEPVNRPQPFPMPPGGSREPIARPQPYPMPGGDDVRDIRGTGDSRNVKGTPNKTKEAQDFKDNYTGKVKKAVSKRKSETIAERRERRKRRNRK